MGRLTKPIRIKIVSRLWIAKIRHPADNVYYYPNLPYLYQDKPLGVIL